MAVRAGFVVFSLFLALFAGPVAAQEQTPEVPTLAPMLERVLPGVVSIAVKGHMAQAENPLLEDPFFRRFFGMPEDVQPQEREFQAAGSGVIVDAGKGYILTNNHVVENADEITVVFSDGRQIPAEKVGSDPDTDLAVLRAEAEDLVALPLGDSDSLKVGDYVVAVGNPFGLSQTATLGIVSALGRTGLGIEGYEDFIQTDASINPGNSGGALVNLQGELVGINSAIIGPAGGNVGIGFAIPINMAQVVMQELIDRGEIRRGRLGVTIQDVTPDLARALRLERPEVALVNQVIAGSPAEAAGIRAGDVIIAVNGSAIEKAGELRLKMALTRVGAEVRLSLVRKGKPLEVTAVLSDRTEAQLSAPSDVPLLTGVVLQPVDPDGPSEAGASVASVNPDSPAGKAGLRSGDVIVGVDQEPVATPDEVVAAARLGTDHLLLQVMRDGGMLFIVIS
jgi:Do/DeqQ family serine protease